MATVTNLETLRLVEADEAEISLLDLVRVLAGRRRMIAGAALIAIAVTAVVMLVLPVSYLAEAVILPPQPEQSSQSMLMGPLAGMSGLGALGGAVAASGLWRNPADVYVGVLKSRTIADALIAQFQLQQAYKRKTMTDTRKALARHSTVAAGKDSLIRIGVEDHDPRRAAGLAN